MTLKSLLVAIIVCTTVFNASADVNVTTHNLENAKAKAYLHEVSYNTGDKSRVKEYNLSPPERRDQPAPITIKWTAPAGVANQLLYVATSKKFKNVKPITLAANTTSNDIYNLIPGQTYYYKVVALNDKGKKKATNIGTAITTGQLRMIKVESGYNFRDIGGWNTASGKHIRYGMIYRSAELNGKYELTSKDSAIVRNIGILAELDLRSDGEAHNITVSRLGADVTYNRLSTGTYYLEGIKNNTTRFKEQMQFVFDMVKQNRPVVFHCHIGADRTGCLGLLLEGLLGVSESDIYKDYELTTFSALGTPRYKGQIEDIIAYIKTFDGVTLEEQFYSYCTQALGLSPQDISDFRNTMLQ